MKYFLLPEKGKFYKTNLHTHTYVSDGKYLPEEVKAKYKAHGYSIVAFSDHEVLVPHLDLNDEDFLALTSYEIAIRDANKNGHQAMRAYHLNLFAKNPNARISGCFTENSIWLERSHQYVAPEMKGQNIKREYSVEGINSLIKIANQEGFLVSYNHPSWSLQNYSDYAGLNGLWGVECYNTGCVIEGYPDTTQPLDDLLRQGKKVFPLATDDSHGDEDLFGGYVMIKAEKLEYNTIMDALERGDFYASVAPEIRELILEDGILKIHTSPAREIIITTERRCNYRKCENGKLLEYVEFDLNNFFEVSRNNANSDYHPYFRVTVLDDEGKPAYTRAFFVSEFEEL